MQCPNFIARHKTKPTAFTRTRKLPFQTLCLFLLNLIKGSTQSELDDFFTVLHRQDVETRFVTASAFSQARENLSHTAFEELNREFTQQFHQEIAAKSWSGYRLLAVDSTTLRLPESDALTEHFGGLPSANDFAVMARLSTCYDVSTGLAIDAQIAPYAVAERDLAVKHLANTVASDLLLYDRGYPAFWLFALHSSTNRDFCMRASVTYSKEIEQFMESSETDAVLEFYPSRFAKIRCIELGVAHIPIKLRALKIPLSTGETEVLLTTLTDAELYPYGVFQDLYNRRWGIEVDYNFKKNKIEIENFTGLSVHAVQQDIAAKVLTQNITMAAIFCAQPHASKRYSHRKFTYKVNVSQGLSAMKHLLVKMLSRDRMVELFEHYIELLIGAVEAVRRDRSFPRTKRYKATKRYHTSIKRAR